MSTITSGQIVVLRRQIVYPLIMSPQGGAPVPLEKSVVVPEGAQARVHSVGSYELEVEFRGVSNATGLFPVSVSDVEV